MYSESRHPHTYAADWIREKAPVRLSRADASRLVKQIASACFVESTVLATALSRQYQIETFEAVFSGTEDLSVLAGAVERNMLHDVLAGEEFFSTAEEHEVEAFVSVLHEAMTRHEPSDVVLNKEQSDRLADLVTFAMIGYNMFKSDTSMPETSSTCINAFMPLVEDEIERRRAARRETYRRDLDI
jgi:hypothetical protein